MTELFRQATQINLDENDGESVTRHAERFLSFLSLKKDLSLKKEERASNDRKNFIDSNKETLDISSDIVGIALHNIDLLIEIKEALDSAPQSALNNALKEIALPGTQFSVLKQDRKFDDEFIDMQDEPPTSRYEAC